MIRFPLPASEFVARQDELAQIGVLLFNPACRLLTLVGPGGIGKTRLALEAAHHSLQPENAYFIPLQPLTSPEFIVPPSLIRSVSNSPAASRSSSFWTPCARKRGF